MYISIYIWLYTCIYYLCRSPRAETGRPSAASRPRRLESTALHPAAVRCDMALPRVFRARHVRNNSIGGEVRHGATSGVSCETSLDKHVTPHLHRECPTALPHAPSLTLPAPRAHLEARAEDALRK